MSGLLQPWPAWVVVEPRTVRKAPWAALPGVSYEGTVLRKEGTITVEVKHCGHRHIGLGPARKCSEALARKLNKENPAPPTVHQSGNMDP